MYVHFIELDACSVILVSSYVYMYICIYVNIFICYVKLCVYVYMYICIYIVSSYVYSVCTYVDFIALAACIVM